MNNFDLSIGQGQEGGEWICRKCGRLYTSQERHKCIKDKKVIYTCKCGKKYGTEQGLLTHQRIQKHL